MKGIPDGKRTADGVLKGLGATVVGDFQKTIAGVTEPGLAETTKAARRGRGNASTKPLLDTRYMFNTMTFEIEGGK